MSTTMESETAVLAPELMLGDEAVALGAIDAGVTGAYAYPGTPSTEIFARVIHEAASTETDVTAHWCANEKSSLEAAIGVSMAGRRALVTMKHVGLNVAADPFMNAPLLGLGGGLVIAVADDPVATRALVEQAGGLFAESIDEFEGLLRLALCFEGRERPGSGRLGVLSNAGFECVAIADSLAGLELAELGANTEHDLERLFDAERLSGFVDVHHPLDVTPIARDEAFVQATESLLADPAVDLAVIGCVPLTAALATLDGQLEAGITPALGELWRRTTKPWCVVVDSGSLYDAFARALTDEGIPVLRSADRATRLLARLFAGRAGPVSLRRC